MKKKKTKKKKVESDEFEESDPALFKKRHSSKPGELFSKSEHQFHFLFGSISLSKKNVPELDVRWRCRQSGFRILIERTNKD